MICQNLYYFCPPTGRGAAMMPALVREGRLTGFAMRYLGRLVAYLAGFFITFSLGYTLLLRWVPVTLTPLKAIRLAEHLPEEGLSGALELGSAAEGGHADGARRDRHRGQPFPLAPGIRLGRDRPGTRREPRGKAAAGRQYDLASRRPRTCFACLPAHGCAKGSRRGSPY